MSRTDQLRQSITGARKKYILFSGYLMNGEEDTEEARREFRRLGEYLKAADQAARDPDILDRRTR